MDEELQQLEAELKQLRPRAVSAGLRQRVAGELAAGRMSRAWAALPLAAALAVAFTLWQRADENQVLAEAEPRQPLAAGSPQPEAQFKPVSVEKLLYDAKDDGAVTLDNGMRVHRMREFYVDTVTWRDPQTNASLRWSVPREEVRLQPVIFQ